MFQQNNFKILQIRCILDNKQNSEDKIYTNLIQFYENGE